MTTKRELESLLRKPAPKPRNLTQVGTGQIYGEQQHCYEKGWREGIAAYREMLRSLPLDDER